MKHTSSLSDRRSRQRERFAGAALAILVQAGFLALLVTSGPVIAPPQQRSKELMFFLPRLPRTAPRPLSLPAPTMRAPRNLVAPLPIVPAPPSLSTLRAAPMAPDLSGLGQSMFGCAPERWSMLTQEQKAKCPRPGEGYAVLEKPDLMHPPNSHVKDEAHWQEEFAREKANLMVPCAGVMSIRGAPVPAIDPLCVLMMLATGHGDQLVDPHKWPHYQVEQMSAYDFAKIEKAYDEWHKAHRGAPASAESVGVHPQ